MKKIVSEKDYNKIKKNIIKKMYANKSFCKGHMLYERLITGIPPHLSGFVKLIISDLVKEELVVFYGKTKHGGAYQLNIEKLKEVESIIFNEDIN